MSHVLHAHDECCVVGLIDNTLYALSFVLLHFILMPVLLLFVFFFTFFFFFLPHARYFNSIPWRDALILEQNTKLVDVT